MKYNFLIPVFAVNNTNKKSKIFCTRMHVDKVLPIFVQIVNPIYYHSKYYIA